MNTRLFAIGLFSFLPLAAVAHHSVPAEYGPSSTPTHYIEGRIVKVMWRNPHVYVNIESTGGELEPGQNWRLTTHPIHIAEGTYGFSKEAFNVGDTVKVHGWFHLRKQPLFHIRAIAINDGPMRSMLRFADLRDIIAGTFKAKGITPTTTLHGSDPSRIGEENVARLAEMGWLDADGMVKVPEGYFEQ